MENTGESARFSSCPAARQSAKFPQIRRAAHGTERLTAKRKNGIFYSNRTESAPVCGKTGQRRKTAPNLSTQDQIASI